MECTQRLECTQELYQSQTERVCPEQVGFLGICGAKHPVLRGPNKIGRDPQTCNIVLNLNSVSRQHAVINVLNSKEFMLMDLDSANKTKLLNRILSPYMPHPLSNGDTVQFGDIFGIFRLLEENDELPMTQAIDVPETPAQSRYASKINKVLKTVIPESPDVSDRDDSFLTPAQTSTERTRLSSGQFIKPFGKKLSKQPVSSPKPDTSPVSSKKCNTSNKDNISLENSLKLLKDDKCIDNIHEMNTQPPYPLANPTVNDSTDSIYMADTQIPPGYGGTPSIHTLGTQLPTIEHLPQVRKIDGIPEMQFDIYAANKKNDLSIFNADTQPFFCKKDEPIDNRSKITDKALDDASKTVKDLNKSEEELLFEEIDDGCLEDFNSQPLLPQESPKAEIKYPKASPKGNQNKSDNLTDCEDIDMIPTQKVEKLGIGINPPKEVMVQPTASKRIIRIKSDSSTDCDDIESIATQKIPELPVTNEVTEHKSFKNLSIKSAKRLIRIQSDSSTDCEDDAIIPTQKILEKKDKDEDVTDCEDDAIEINSNVLSKDVRVRKTGKKSAKILDPDTQLTQIIAVDENAPPKLTIYDSFEDQPTQVIPIDENALPKSAENDSFEDQPTQMIAIDENVPTNSTNNDSFEDQPTQIIDEIIPTSISIPTPTKKNFNEIISPFKIPLQSPLKLKSKEIPKIIPKDQKSESKFIDNDPNYYNDTQDILEDLCTQRDASPISKIVPNKSKVTSDSPIIMDDEIVPCSVEDYKVGDKFANIDREASPHKSFGEQTAKIYAAGLSEQEVRDVIGVEPVDKLKKIPSDSSDLECTPKKSRPFLFTDSDLPNSQEIHDNIFIKPDTKSYTIESSSESEPEQNSEEQSTPFVHRKKKPKTTAKIDLTKRFDVENLPERIITRVRKPTAKMQESSKLAKKVSPNILKAKFLTEQEDHLDEDIIKENVKRLKTYEKAKSMKNIKHNTTAEEDTSGSKSEHNKTESNSNENKTETNSNEIKTKTNSNEFKNETNSNEVKTATFSNEIKNETATENKSIKPKEKIKVKIEKPKKKDTKKDKKSKDKEESLQKDHTKSNTDRSREKSPAHKSRDDTGQKSKHDKTSDVSALSAADAKISTRSTRTRRKVTDKAAEEQSKSPDNNEKALVDNNKKRPTRKREPPKESTSPEVEIRRSRRQVKAKENKSDSQDSQITQAPKSILKKSIHEQSTVYNVSSSSGETPKNLKRSLGDDTEVPSPKRTRSFVNNSTSNTSSVSLRATPARTMKTQHVLFTAFPSDEVKHKLEKLGAAVVTNVMECSVVLTMQVKRTFKLLCAVGLGRPIVGPGWVQACVDTHMIVDPWLYLIKDDAAEKRFQFNLGRTLNGKRNFLKGYNVSSTPSVQPNATEMKLIVECSGGIWKEGGSNWVCVSSAKDQALWPSLRKRGATVVTTEFILGGVLRQKIELIANKFP